MEALALYLIKSTVWLTGFALVYLLFLSNERFFLLNRIFLVLGILGSIVFPFFTWHYTVMIPNFPTVGTVEVADLQMMGTVVISEPFPTQALLLYIYLAGALYLLYRITRQTRSVLKVIRKSEILPYRSAKLIRTTEYPASFSFFSFVFVNPSTCDTETNEIVNHEMEHIRQQHWIDLLLFECLCTLQWYNPMSWLYGRFIRQNHEYLADERALQRTTNPAIYRAALLNQLFGGPVITLANSFNYSINKKRFNMMKQTIYSPIRKLKLLLALPLMAGVFYAFATPEYKYIQAEDNPTQDEVLTNPDTTTKGSITTINGNFVSSASKDTTSAPGLKFTAKKVQATYKNGIEKIKAEAISIDLAKTTSLVFIEGKESTKAEVDQLNPDRIESVSILKGESATNKYGEKGKDGVIEISLKKGTAEGENLNSATSQILKLQTNSPLKFGNPEGSSTQPLIVKDGVITGLLNVNNISPETIESINVLKGESAIKKYGVKGKNGVIEITMKKDGTSFKNDSIDLKMKGDVTNKKEIGIYSVVEQMPEFPGGAEAWRFFIARNIKYPALAHEKGIEGKVYINFVVSKTGIVTDAKVVRGDYPSLDNEVITVTASSVSTAVVSGGDPSLDREALRVINSLPTWKPGKQNGENVDVEYTIPISFEIEKATEKEIKPQAEPTVQKNNLMIVPNPTQDKATITLVGSDSTNKLEVSIIDSFGKLISKETKKGPSFTLSVAKLTTGTYLVVAIDGTTQYQGHLVVNH